MSKIKPLSEKIKYQLIVLCALRWDMNTSAEQFADATDKIEEDAKEKVQNAKKRLKMLMEMYPLIPRGINIGIKRIFKEEFGDLK